MLFTRQIARRIVSTIPRGMKNRIWHEIFNCDPLGQKLYNILNIKFRFSPIYYSGTLPRDMK